MFYTEEIKLNQAADLLSLCGLTMPRAVDYTAGVFQRSDSADRLVACGSLKGDMIQGIAVDPEFQGEDLTAKVITHLAQKASEKGIRSLYLFTKPEKAVQFMGLGFRLAASARPYAALLEWGSAGISQYVEKLRKCKEMVFTADAPVDSEADFTKNIAASAETSSTAGIASRKSTLPVGALVMNCNPFTRGHRYLIEKAAAACSHVFLLVVEEDVSEFSFGDRFAMVKAGTADLKNVTVISGGRYAVSSLTFPSYFTREENLAHAHAAIDAELFAQVIAPALSVSVRFVGTEPYSQVTEIYNETLKKRLPKAGIRVEEIPRLTAGGEAVSASRVREILHAEGAGSEKLADLLPETTLNYLSKINQS